jgi:hypothetical protein
MAADDDQHPPNRGGGLRVECGPLRSGSITWTGANRGIAAGPQQTAFSDNRETDASTA